MEQTPAPKPSQAPNPSPVPEVPATMEVPATKDASRTPGTAKLKENKIILRIGDTTYEVEVLSRDKYTLSMDALLSLFKQHINNQQFQADIDRVAAQAGVCEVQLQKTKVEKIVFYDMKAGKKVNEKSYQNLAEKTSEFAAHTPPLGIDKTSEVEEVVAGKMEGLEIEEEEDAEKSSVWNRLKEGARGMVLRFKERFAKKEPERVELNVRGVSLPSVLRDSNLSRAAIDQEEGIVLTKEDYHPGNIEEIDILAKIDNIDLNNEEHRMIVERFCAKMKMINQEVDSNNLDELFMNVDFQEVLPRVIRCLKFSPGSDEIIQGSDYIKILEQVSDKRKFYFLFAGKANVEREGAVANRIPQEPGVDAAHLVPHASYLKIRGGELSDTVHWPLVFYKSNKTGDAHRLRFTRMQISNSEIKKALKEIHVKNLDLFFDINDKRDEIIKINEFNDEIQRISDSYLEVMKMFVDLNDFRSARYMQWELDCIKRQFLIRFKEHYKEKLSHENLTPLQPTLDRLLIHLIPGPPGIRIAKDDRPFDERMNATLERLDRVTQTPQVTPSSYAYQVPIGSNFAAQRIKSLPSRKQKDPGHRT